LAKESARTKKVTKRAAAALLVDSKIHTKQRKVSTTLLTTVQDTPTYDPTDKKVDQPHILDKGRAVPENQIVIDGDTPVIEHWIKHSFRNGSVYLYTTNMERIQSGGWLADSEVSAVQCLLRNQFPLVDHLMDCTVQDATVLAAGHAVPCTSQFVQILNTGAHWVCMSNIQASERNTVDVYDSICLQRPASYWRKQPVEWGDECKAVAATPSDMAVKSGFMPRARTYPMVE